jgi:hypothetical protein
MAVFVTLFPALSSMYITYHDLCPGATAKAASDYCFKSYSDLLKVSCVGMR